MNAPATSSLPWQTEDQGAIIEMVRQFVDEQIIPNAEHYDAKDEIRAAFSLSEPELGSDVQAIKTSARKREDGAYEINGQKMWVTNGLMSGVVFVLVRTDPKADPPYKGMTCFIAEKEPGESHNDGL